MIRTLTVFLLFIFISSTVLFADDKSVDADALIIAFIENDINGMREQLKAFREIKDCDTKCLDYRQQAFVFLMETGREERKYQKVRQELALFIAEYYSPVFNKDFILDCLFSVRNQMEAKGETFELFKLYYHLSTVYFNEKSFAKAIEFGKLCLRLNEKSENDPGRIINLINTIGLSYRYLNQTDSSLHYFDKAIALAEQRKDLAWIGLLNGNKALAFLQKGDTLTALSLLDVDIRLSLDYGWKSSALNAMGLKMNLLAHSGKNKEAEIIRLKLQESLEEATSVASEFFTPYNTLADYFELQKDYGNALVYRKKADSLNGLLLAREARSSAEMADQLFLSRQYERSAKARFNEIYSRQQRWKSALFVSMALLIFLAVVLIIMHKRNKWLKQIAEQNETIKEAYLALEQAKNALVLKQEVLQNQSKELENVNRKLAETDNFRQATTNMIVHDLKNSLYNIIGLSSAQEGNKAFETISETSKKMLRMVLNILDLRKFEEARMQLHCVAFSVFDLIGLVLKDLELSFRNKSLSVTVDCQKELLLFADKELIRRLLENLLTNAINHTSLEKEIVVKAFSTENVVRIEVLNWGSFIPEDKKQSIFEAFTQAEPSKGEIRSNGLGLAFCKMVVSRHDGIIGVDSIAGQETTFWIQLPSSGQFHKSEEMIRHITDFSTGIAKLSENNFQLPDELKQLLQFEVYDMSKVLSVLQTFQTDGNETASAWKKAVENAVYHCDNVRYKELVKMLDGRDLNNNTI